MLPFATPSKLAGLLLYTETLLYISQVQGVLRKPPRGYARQLKCSNSRSNKQTACPEISVERLANSRNQQVKSVSIQNMFQIFHCYIFKK